MLALHIPHRVHQLNGVERGPPLPRRPRRMRRLALKRELNRHQPAVIRRLPPRSRQLRPHVRTQHNVDVFKQPRPHIKRLRRHQFFRHPRIHLQRSFDLVFNHEVLQRQRRHNVHSVPGVVPFAMPRRALNHRVVIRHARLLIGARNPVQIGDEPNHRLAAIRPSGHPSRRNPGHPALHSKPVLLQ